MVVVLPKEINGLEDFENKIKDVDLEKFAKWPQSFRRREIILHMPKFKVEKTLELESVLRKVSSVAKRVSKERGTLVDLNILNCKLAVGNGRNVNIWKGRFPRNNKR